MGFYYMRQSQELTHCGVDAKGMLCQVFVDIRGLFGLGDSGTQCFHKDLALL